MTEPKGSAGALGDGLPAVEAVDELPLESLPGLVVHLAALQARAAIRMQKGAQTLPEATGALEALHDADAVAGLLDVPTDYVYGLGRRGELPRVQFGKYVRFRLKDVHDWIDRHTEAGLERALSSTYSSQSGRSGNASHPEATRADTSPVGRRGGSAPKQRRAVGAGRDGRPRDRGTADPNSGDAGAEEG